MAMWNNPEPGGAYHFTLTCFATPHAFDGVKALRSIAGRCSPATLPTPFRFLIPPAGLGDSYSLVAANFRTGTPPPAGRDEMLLAVDSPATENVTLTQVKALAVPCRFCHPGEFDSRHWRQS